MGRLSDRVALITGGARGQGEAEVRLFHSEGAKVVIADVLEAPGKALEQELGERALFVRLDVSSEEAWHEAVAVTLDRFGKLDILVNNAGILKLNSLLEMPLDDYMAVVNVNQVGCFLGLKIGGRAIIDSGGGSIVNTSSIGGLWGIPGGAAYSASKFAVTGMTKTAAIEFGASGVRVNSIHPGIIDTDMVRNLGMDDSAADDAAAALLVGRMGTPKDIAFLALFLASDESGFCTGSSFTADGGVMAGEIFKTDGE
ncbi:MAG: glucose 1-dehydrogenase [Deltaproteobacteria bacterium]|jgi:3alpha(or 20beta)-hydroxysteroid dehydrogenase|nr:glucose 1-dehydrogenase [Deltaproteobacteria bacterium]MBW2399402.1 glucose 1-dehydrogenase [Deltaproteobacteria bacterium]